jgi:TonB family protein
MGILVKASVFVLATIAIPVAWPGTGPTSSDDRPAIYRPVPATPEEMDRGPQLRELDIDARVADFAEWVEDFEQRIHHNWIVPRYRGYGGRVDLEVVVERNGTITTLEVVEATASKALVDAAREAFSRSRLEPLPEAYERLRVSMRVTCVYGPPPGE